MKTEDITTLSTGDLDALLAKADGLIAQIWTMLPGLVTLDHDARVHSSGRLRDGEAKALGAVLDVVAAHPELFSFLAARDFGKDPKKVETDLLRARLAQLDALRAFADTVHELANALTDTALSVGEKVRPPLLAAYKVAQVAAEGDDKLRTMLAPATDFYGKIARTAAATKRKKALSTQQAK